MDLSYLWELKIGRQGRSNIAVVVAVAVRRGKG